jgi:hypothetical protein
LAMSAVRSRAIAARAGEMSQAVIAASAHASATSIVVEPGPHPISNALNGPAGAEAATAERKCGAKPSSAASVSLQRRAQMSPLVVAQSGTGAAELMLSHRTDA